MPPIAITMGDPSGIGPEIIVKLFAQKDCGAALVIGDLAILRRACRLAQVTLALREIAHPREAHFEKGKLNVISCSHRSEDQLPLGQINREAGQAAYDYVEQAVSYALKKEIAALVTAPIHKEALHLAGHNFPGHTEILAALTGTKDFAMMLVNDELRVLLVSIHLPLAEAIRRVNIANELKSIRLAHSAGTTFGIAKPRIAVAGLNPHAGESGLFGREELDEIIPAIQQARGEGIDASGPFPPDTVYLRARQGEFDLVVAQYHDQGLIPIKYLGLDRGVNITVGLPFIRTSVDHGTAFDIAGTGRADPASLEAALDLANALAQAAPAQRLGTGG